MNRWIKWQKLDMIIPSILGTRGAASPTPYTSPKSSVDFYVRSLVTRIRRMSQETSAVHNTSARSLFRPLYARKFSIQSKPSQ